MSTEKEIFVYADTEDMEQALFLGTLHSALIRGKEIFSFEYSKDCLRHPSAFALDPNLSLYEGRHFSDDAKPNFGIFTDSAPDRWGRILMNRREALNAKHENRAPKKLLESDYLLGVYDNLRMGALRLKTSRQGEFLNNDKKLSAPPFSSLRELEAACRNLENDGESSDSERVKWLNMLIAPGSSLGGARPKSNVVDTNGNLWIAKFPSKNDEGDTEAWEMVANELALTLGMNVPECDLKKFGKHHTFLSKRFDREDGKRIHFASAMTLLGYSDGTGASNGANYIELAEFITRNDIGIDLREMWTRIVFNICIGNSDDHLRNHGFLLGNSGRWKLSPVYDINPNPHAQGLSLNINEDSNALDLELALEVAKYFKVSKRDAKDTVQDFADTISERWDIYASDYGISKSEQDYYSSAFSAAMDWAK